MDNIFRRLCIVAKKKNFELASSCLSVRPSSYPCLSAPSGRYSVKFDNGDCYENLSRNSKFG